MKYFLLYEEAKHYGIDWSRPIPSVDEDEAVTVEVPRIPLMTIFGIICRANLTQTERVTIMGLIFT